MSRKSRRGALAPNTGQAPIVPDASREASESPLVAAPSSGGGVSAMSGNWLTEGSFLQRPKITLVDSPFGQRYISTKSRGMASVDNELRLITSLFDVKGYWDSGTVTNSIQDATAAHTLLRDWYALARDMGKRSLKYKHIPVSLTNTEVLRYYINGYFYVVANLASLLNLNRLPHYGPTFGYLTAALPQYMSRISRLWRRTSALPAPQFVKAHAIRCGMINWQPNRLCPVVRFWALCSHANGNMLAYASGGPLTEVNDNTIDTLQAGTNLGLLVNSLENVERWLETGTSTILTDWTAMKDLIDMVLDVIPGSFTTGLPEGQSMPGLVTDPSLHTDILCNVVSCKDDQATDQWGLFPVPGLEAEYGSRIPVMGFGAPTLYDYCSLGRTKVAWFNADYALIYDDVNSPVRWLGTDLRVTASLQPTISSELSATNFGTIAGNTLETIIPNSLNTPYEPEDPAFDFDSAAAWRAFIFTDGMQNHHIWGLGTMTAVREAKNSGWNRFVEECGVDYKFYMEPTDLGLNYATLIAHSLGIPFIK